MIAVGVRVGARDRIGKYPFRRTRQTNSEKAVDDQVKFVIVRKQGDYCPLGFSVSRDGAPGGSVFVLLFTRLQYRNALPGFFE